MRDRETTRAWHAQPARSVAASLEADPERGLAPAEAAARLARVGPNLLRPREQEPWWKEWLESLGEPLQLLLLVVGAAYFLLGEVADAVTIVAVVFVSSGVEAFNELRAKRAVRSLSALTAAHALAVRAGSPIELPAAELVPGDLVLLEPGERVPADLRLVEAVALRVDESSLTGEAAAVAKRAEEELPEAIELGERRTMAFSSTLVTAGRGRGLVVATGRSTEIGRIASLSEEAREPRTPLQLAMRQLSRWLLFAAIGMSVLIPALGVLVAGLPLEQMVLTGLTLAFATVPEELPMLITIVLGLGAWRLAQRRAIVKHLRAAETLGSVSVVASDKTGTLTENRMRAVALIAGGTRREPREAAGTTAGRRLLEAAVLANDAQPAFSGPRAGLVGDPIDTALLVAAEEAGLDIAAIRRGVEVIGEHPFDDRRKRMSVLVESAAGRRLLLKGAPESVLEACAAEREGDGVRPLDEARRAQLQAEVEALAGQGLRTLAFAERPLEAGESMQQPAGQLEQRLVLLGLMTLEDPPRAEASEAVSALEHAGVRVLMLTGDHPATARAIAARVGIDASRVVGGRELDRASEPELSQLVGGASVFARITPEHKLRVVRALQSQGEAVAVTGDGVNDAPALREAAIGVAMGKGGTDVAREAADLVLADDDLATVTEAVRTGRVLFANLSKAVRYYLAVKVALVSSSLVAVLMKLPVPFEPVQIIVMELFMDLAASTTFVAEPPEEDVMARPPRDPRAPFMSRAMKLGIFAGGLSLGAAVLVSYLTAWARGADRLQAQTAAFVAWMLGHVVLAAHMRAEHQPLLRQRPAANRAFLVWAAATLTLVVLALAVPVVRERLHVETIDPVTALVAVAAALLFPSWWEPWKWSRRTRPDARRVP